VAVLRQVLERIHHSFQLGDLALQAVDVLAGDLFFTAALGRDLFLHRLTSSLMSPMAKPRVRARLMKRSMCTSFGPYTR
jgi:hypothetical protein